MSGSQQTDPRIRSVCGMCGHPIYRVSRDRVWRDDSGMTVCPDGKTTHVSEY